MGWESNPFLRRSRLIAFVLLLILAMVVSTVVQYGFGTLGPYITEEFGLSKVQFALLPAGLALSGSLLSPVAGRLVDRHGPRRMTVALFVSAVLAGILIVTAGLYGQVFLAAILLGLPMAISNPVTNNAISSEVVASRQGTIVGYKQAGVPLSVLLAGMLLPALSAELGWRMAMAVLTLPALLGLALVPLLEAPRPAATGCGAATPLSAPASGRLVRLLPVYALLMGLGQGSIPAFLPLYAHETLRQSVATGGLLVAAFGATSIAARIFWGYVANRSTSLLWLLRHLAVVAAVSAAIVILAGLVDWRLAWFGAIGFGLTTGAWQTPMWVALIRGGGGTSGSMSGLVTRGFFIGLMFSPVIFGFVVDVGAGYFVAWGVVAAMFLIASFVRPERH